MSIEKEFKKEGCKNKKSILLFCFFGLLLSLAIIQAVFSHDGMMHVDTDCAIACDSHLRDTQEEFSTSTNCSFSPPVNNSVMESGTNIPFSNSFRLVLVSLCFSSIGLFVLVIFLFKYKCKCDKLVKKLELWGFK